MAERWQVEAPRVTASGCRRGPVAYRDQAYLVEVPVEGGGRLVVEAGPSLLPAELELASPRPGRIVARARESLEESLDQIQPALAALTGRLRAMAPEEFTVEFGLTFGAEAGLFVASGKGEVHLNVTLSWKNGGNARSRPPDGASRGADRPTGPEGRGER
jgi:Trypsin-co-occurring domain 1